MLSLAE